MGIMVKLKGKQEGMEMNMNTHFFFALVLPDDIKAYLNAVTEQLNQTFHLRNGCIQPIIILRWHFWAMLPIH